MWDNIRLVPDFRHQNLDTISTLDVQQNWGLSFIDATDAWKLTKGIGIKIAVIDTGWQPHPDLVTNFISGFDATDDNSYFDKGNFHGLHVAGIIAANCGDRFGVNGVAPDAKLIIIKAIDASGCGSYDYLLKALQIVRDIDVDIVNMSIGTPLQPPDDRMHGLLKEIAAQGKLVVCAAGNDGSAVQYPAKYDEVIAVSALAADGTLAKFSSRGPESDVAAPGVQIYSTWGNNQYINLDGTSMACPCISGMIALIISWHKQNPNPLVVINYKEILKLLYDMSGEQGHIVQANEYNISVPRFLNWTPEK